MNHVRPQFGTANSDALLAEDGSPESCHFNIGSENRQQVSLGWDIPVRRFPDKAVGREPNARRRVLEPLFELCRAKTFMSILHSINAVSPFANATANSWTNCSRSRMVIFSSSVSSVLMTRFLVFHAATWSRSPDPKTPFNSPAVESKPMCPLCKGVNGLVLSETGWGSRICEICRYAGDVGNRSSIVSSGRPA